MRKLIGVVFLFLQLCLVIYAQFTSQRYFCWAPNDYTTTYELHVHVGGRWLTPEEAIARYRIPPNAQQHYENIPTHVMDFIRQYEQTYGRNDHAQVLLTWHLNGHPEEHQWVWPPE